MGKKDVYSKMFFQNNEHFAEIVNYYLFQGERIIQADCLSDEDVQEMHNICETNIRERDILKSVYSNDFFIKLAIIGLEPESSINYTEPVKLCSYDIRRYEKQIKELQKKYKEKMHSRGAEFISGIAKNDKLIPVITIALYLGSEKWDGPKSLVEMLDCNNLSERLNKYINDYKINLIVPSEMSDRDIDSFSKDIQALMGFVKHSQSKSELLDYLDKKRNILDSIDIDTYKAIDEFTGNKLPPYEEKGDIVNMCRGIDELIEDSIEQGEKNAEISLAKKLIESGVNINIIASACDILTLEDIQNL